jgi:outer membrane protein assembly factor BamD (BamD/ComL family)
MAAWDRMGKDAPDFEDRALFGKARLLEREQKWDDARKVYEQLKKDHAQSPIMRQASERLATLNVLHPPAAGQPAGAADAG